ncbi:Heparan sulfate 2-O-sulfotransferase 1 [Anthophora retusa]
MRLNRGLLTSVVACLTVFLIVFNSKSTIEIANDSGSGIEKPYVRGPDIRRDQISFRYVTPSLAELAARGNLPKSNRHILMLTRVPEAGAELLVLILQRLQGYNAFKHIRLPPGDHGLLSTLQEELLVEEITNIIRQEAVPLSFDGDVRFFNFSKFGRQSPSFISLVRNPVGAHNFQRYRQRRKNTSQGRAIPTFCGQDPRCTQVNNKWALQRAKLNIIEWYPVVGVLDCLEQSIDLLERKFPYFFRGAKQIYEKIHPRKKNFCDAAVASKSRQRDTLFKYFEDEMEFYQWIKARLFNETFIDLGENYYT